MGNRVLIPQPMGTCPPIYKEARPPEAMHPLLGAPEPSQNSPPEVDFLLLPSVPHGGVNLAALAGTDLHGEGTVSTVQQKVPGRGQAQLLLCFPLPLPVR